MVELHTPIQESVDEAIQLLAERRATDKNELVREALDQFLKQERRRERDEEMGRYAREMAEFSGEFVEEFEEAVTENLLRSTEWDDAR